MPRVDEVFLKLWRRCEYRDFFSLTVWIWYTFLSVLSQVKCIVFHIIPFLSSSHAVSLTNHTQVLSHPDAREHHGYDAAVCLATLVNYRKHEVEIVHYLWRKMFPLVLVSLCVFVWMVNFLSVCLCGWSIFCLCKLICNTGRTKLSCSLVAFKSGVCLCTCVSVLTSTLLTVFFGSSLPTAVLFILTLSRGMNWIFSLCEPFLSWWGICFVEWECTIPVCVCVDGQFSVCVFSCVIS